MESSRSLVFTALVALLSMHGHAGAATFRVGAGSGCTHATIQAAIDAAADTPETDFIRITRSLTYSDQALEIEDQHLVLDGGYASCGTDFGDDTRATVTGDGDHSVIKIRGSGDVVLSHLTITGGHEPLFNYGYGGGIQISGGPHLVSLTQVLVTGNEAGHGGGISVRNDISGDPNQVQLVLNDDTVVSFNTAEFAPDAGSQIQGGGIYCFESSIRMIGGGSTSITGNNASQDGGGIGAVECDLTIAPHGTFGSFNGLVLNDAGRDGGGLAIEGPSGGGTKFYATESDKPVYVSGNSAGREGGGIKINSLAQVTAWDLILDGNRSYGEGGGVSVFCGGGDGDAQFTMYGTAAGAPAGAVSCVAGKHCNSISDNVAQNDSGTPQAAAAVRVKGNPFFGEFCDATARLLGTHIERNVGKNVMRVYEPEDFGDIADASAAIRGAVIAGNEVSSELLLTGTSPTNSDADAFTIDATTIAGNTIGGADVIHSHSNISLDHSIVWQPGKRVLNLSEGNLDPDQVSYLLASDLIEITLSPTNFIAEPRLMDPELDDFHLHASSPAIDYAPTSTDPEADDLPRVVNLALVPDTGGFGPQDLGAYERQSIGNLVRNAEFDDDLHIWIDAAPAATSWGAEDHAGSSTSGSIEVFDTTTATRVVGLRQCVGIPGPSVYKLSGYSWTHGVRFLPTPDHAILAWNYYPDSADCTGGVAGSGESEAPDDTEWRAITPQYIDVASDEWTPNSSVEIQLIQQKTTNQIGGDSDLVRFDGIALVPDSDVIFADGFD